MNDETEPTHIDAYQYDDDWHWPDDIDIFRHDEFDTELVPEIDWLVEWQDDN